MAMPDISDNCALPPVHVAEDRVIRTVVGLRPFRPSGFVVRAEALGDKRLVHNYGHGGAGITLCWGTAKLATELALPGHSGPVAVLGAGAVGLATARLVQEAGFPVTIYAKALPPETTSNIAGGQWFPARAFQKGHASDAFVAQFRAASVYAYRRYQLLAGARYGIRWMKNYYCSDRPFDVDPYSSLIPDLLPETRMLAKTENPWPHAYVRQQDGMIVEPSIFLREMLIDVYGAGGKVVVRPFANVAEIAALPERVVINCTGLGSRDLFGDRELTAMRGQLSFLLPQPEVRYAVSAPGGIYMFSRTDGILLGGTGDLDNFSLEPDMATRARILAGHKALFAGLRRC
ncbi:FAD-dependent oxidoreductase [Sphingomonas oleivorans]|uniref:D-amino-acid oxidase n=2 Tax=Sphingomonas oleivorans TaxID=1735121 RepID=A0A2T5FXY7_9SPHN|nr:FAD-dependent oxidoreductase [Sphingomonas oleivorans]